MLLIPGTPNVSHLHENHGAAALQLPKDIMIELSAITWSQVFRMQMLCKLHASAIYVSFEGWVPWKWAT